MATLARHSLSSHFDRGLPWAAVNHPTMVSYAELPSTLVRRRVAAVEEAPCKRNVNSLAFEADSPAMTGPSPSVALHLGKFSSASVLLRLMVDARKQLLEGIEHGCDNGSRRSSSRSHAAHEGVLSSIHAAIVELDDALDSDQATTDVSTLQQSREWLKQLQCFVLGLHRDLAKLRSAEGSAHAAAALWPLFSAQAAAVLQRVVDGMPQQQALATATDTTASGSDCASTCTAVGATEAEADGTSTGSASSPSQELDPRGTPAASATAARPTSPQSAQPPQPRQLSRTLCTGAVMSYTRHWGVKPCV